jgi:small acid-soluble spore protein F (minor alpha/beta-type SASP)
MGRRRGIMSDALKYELARELGVHHLVDTEGWGSVPSRDCGRLVQKAIEFAEKSLASRYRS